jgi:hypothetical protein
MTEPLTGTALIDYLRDNPTSDAMRMAADEIERLHAAATLALSIAESYIRSDYEGTAHYRVMLKELDPVRAVLTPQREHGDTECT